MPSADSFCDCVTFGILGTFQRTGEGGWVVIGWCGLLTSYAKRRNKKKKEFAILTVKVKLAWRNSMSLVSRW